MTDKELLERAATAAGIALDYSIRPDGKAFYHSERNAFATADGGWFAPLTDDGDTLRLAVKLKMKVWITDHGAAAQTGNDFAKTKLVALDEAKDLNDALRRAITRAAAAMAPAEQAQAPAPPGAKEA